MAEFDRLSSQFYSFQNKDGDTINVKCEFRIVFKRRVTLWLNASLQLDKFGLFNRRLRLLFAMKTSIKSWRHSFKRSSLGLTFQCWQKYVHCIHKIELNPTFFHFPKHLFGDRHTSVWLNSSYTLQFDLIFFIFLLSPCLTGQKFVARKTTCPQNSPTHTHTFNFKNCDLYLTARLAIRVEGQTTVVVFQRLAIDDWMKTKLNTHDFDLDLLYLSQLTTVAANSAAITDENTEWNWMKLHACSKLSSNLVSNLAEVLCIYNFTRNFVVRLPCIDVFIGWITAHTHVWLHIGR